MPNDRIAVAHIVEATLGGVKKHVLDLCTGLDPARFELHALLSPLRDPSFEATREVLEQAGVGVVEMPMQRSLSPGKQMASVREVSRVLSDLKPDIVHCHSSIAGLVGRLASWRAGITRTVYTPHGFPFTMRVSYPLRLAFLSMERHLGRRTSRTITVCESEGALALRARVARADQCVVIENGIAFAPPPQIDRGRKLAEMGLPPDAQVILCVGDLRPQKGHAGAILALAQVVRSFPGAHLIIAGQGELRERLLKEAAQLGIADHVHLLGPRDDVPELLACCDVFCQPSLWEGCPYAVIEAAAAGCAMVATDIPGSSDVVRPGETGWLVPTWDLTGLGKALQYVLSEPDTRADRGRKAAQFVRERHSLARMLELTAGLYEELCSGPSGS